MRKILLSLCLLFAACSSDDEPMPSYVESLADLVTNARGEATTLVLDKGETYTLSAAPSGLLADTTYRILALYLPTDDHTASLTNYAQVLAPALYTYSDEVITTDPLQVIACWRGRDYINLRIGIKGSSTGGHRFGFHNAGIAENADSSCTLRIILLHDQNDDPQYFTRNLYISLPLRSLPERLQTGRDSISLSAQTFDGTFQQTFAY